MIAIARYDPGEGAHGVSRDDVHAQQVNYLRQDGDFIDFKITVSTSPDQIAIAPGYLARGWTEGGRRYFRYEMDQPILNCFSVLLRATR